MTWSPEAPDGNESGKIKYVVLPYLLGTGLDLGCGPNKVAQHAIGVDSARTEATDIVSDITKLPMFADGSMDFVFSSHALEDQEDLAATLTEWWRLVKVGGHLVLYLPHADHYPRVGQPGSNPAHKHDLLPGDVVKMMIEVGEWDLLEDQERSAGIEWSFLQIYRKTNEGAGHRFVCDEPKPARTAGVVRLGAIGDAIWSSTVTWHLKREGYRVTVYTGAEGMLALKHDPNVDELVEVAGYQLERKELIPYFGVQSLRYDRWVNLTQSVEVELLPNNRDMRFYLEDSARHRLMNKNYMEQIHDYASLPYEFHQHYYPSEDEAAWAASRRKQIPGPLVVINPGGSSLAKWFPHTQDLMAELAQRGIYSVVLGDTRGQALEDVEPFGSVIGTTLPLRRALAVAMTADIVIGVESAMVNAVAMVDRIVKIVILSHSSPENLTKHWTSTIPVTSSDVPCYPCHRLHEDWVWCLRDPKTGTAACQTISAEELAGLVDAVLIQAMPGYKPPPTAVKIRIKPDGP